MNENIIGQCPYSCGGDITWQHIYSCWLDSSDRESPFVFYCPGCEEEISVQVDISPDFYDLKMERRKHHDSWHDRRHISPAELHRRERREREHGRRSYDRARWRSIQAVTKQEVPGPTNPDLAKRLEEADTALMQKAVKSIEYPNDDRDPSSPFAKEAEAR